MYKLSVPIGLPTVTNETLPKYLKIFKECKVDRVFLCPLESPDNDKAYIYKESEMIQQAVDYFKSNGFEVGIWVDTLGHGVKLSHSDDDAPPYTQIKGINGDVSEHGNCPLDERFADNFLKGIKRIAEFHPDLIMLDDDFRLNLRSYYMGCFCENHLREYYKLIGEEVPRCELEKLIFSGGKNKYRDAYMKLMGETLVGFAERIRKTVNEVDKNIRVSACSCYDNIDFSGTDEIALTKAFAGETAPYLRTIGAPFWENNIIRVIENTRLQGHWYKDEGFEVFVEGDVYPRQRYKIPAKILELYETVLKSTGAFQGILKYMFDYNHKLDYEEEYYKSHIRNYELKEKIVELFKGKKPVGITPVNVMHKIQNWELGDTLKPRIAERMIDSYNSTSTGILSKNTIPTSYDICGYPLLVLGENARYVEREELKNGAILDVKAAEILKDRGIDTGIISSENGSFSKEYFISGDDAVLGVDNGALKKIVCDARATVISRFLPGDTPASYTYENTDGLRFFVLAYDHYMADENMNHVNNYYRQSDIVGAVKWLCGRELPVTCLKHPNLYVLTSKDKASMSVLFANISIDDVIEPVIKLDKAYNEIKFVNCTGTLCGNKVCLSDITPYGIAAFEVK